MSRSISIRVMVLFAILVVSTQYVQAVPITFIHKGKGDATLGGVNLGVVDFTITGHGDTDDRESDGPGYYNIPHSSTSITIARTTYDFLVDTVTTSFSRFGDGNIGFGLAPATPAREGIGLFFGPTGISELYDWDMLSSVGPVSGPGELLQWDWAGVDTTGGVLELEGNYPATFTAIVVPEPTTLLLLGLGAAMVRRTYWPPESVRHLVGYSLLC